jgi:hypothetical protein
LSSCLGLYPSRLAARWAARDKEAEQLALLLTTLLRWRRTPEALDGLGELVRVVGAGPQAIPQAVMAAGELFPSRPSTRHFAEEGSLTASNTSSGKELGNTRLGVWPGEGEAMNAFVMMPPVDFARPRSQGKT